MGSSTKDNRDPYYRRAKKDAFRARSAYKLIQINEAFDLFHYYSQAPESSSQERRPVVNAVDLCAAPGSWSQVLHQKLVSQNKKAVVVAVDLQELAPISGVITLQGDISRQETLERISQYFKDGRKAQLIVCDGAPEVTGMHDVDEHLQFDLVLAALRFAVQLLETNGNFVTKIFQGRHLQWIFQRIELFFQYCHCIKPDSSRNSSREQFIVCGGFRLPDGIKASNVDSQQAFNKFIEKMVLFGSSNIGSNV